MPAYAPAGIGDHLQRNMAESHLAGVGEDGRAVAFDMLVGRAKASFGQHTSKRSLAHFQRITPHVVAIQLDQVEGVEKGVTVMASVADTVERGNAVVVAGDSFAIDDASVALRTSSGSRRRSSPFSSMRSKA